jgi:hypothetical protein
MTSTTKIVRSFRRFLAILATGIVATAATVLVGANPASAAGQSGWGGYGYTVAYCGNAHDLHQYNVKNFVTGDYDGQRVGVQVAVHDDLGWHVYSWAAANAAANDPATFNTTVEGAVGWHAVVYTRYAWLYWDGWHITGWDQAAYQTIWGTSTSYCEI